MPSPYVPPIVTHHTSRQSTPARSFANTRLTMLSSTRRPILRPLRIYPPVCPIVTPLLNLLVSQAGFCLTAEDEDADPGTISDAMARGRPYR
jgi:hypothetical protein